MRPTRDIVPGPPARIPRQEGQHGMIRTTPFHERTSALNETRLWSHWSGTLAADRYQMSDKFEYFAVRNAAGVFDSSPLYKYRITGPDAERFLAGDPGPRHPAPAAPGHAQYTCWCDDARLRHRGRRHPPARRKDEYLLTAAEPNLAYFADLIGRLAGHDRGGQRRTTASSPCRARARATCWRASSRRCATSRYFGLATGKIGGAPVTVSRTGYTGDLGYEIWVDGRRRAARLGRALGRVRRPRRPAVRARPRCTCSASRPACCCSTSTSTPAGSPGTTRSGRRRSSSAAAGCSRTSPTTTGAFIGRRRHRARDRRQDLALGDARARRRLAGLRPASTTRPG